MRAHHCSTQSFVVLLALRSSSPLVSSLAPTSPTSLAPHTSLSRSLARSTAAARGVFDRTHLPPPNHTHSHSHSPSRERLYPLSRSALRHSRDGARGRAVVSFRGRGARRCYGGRRRVSVTRSARQCLQGWRCVDPSQVPRCRLRRQLDSRARDQRYAAAHCHASCTPSTLLASFLLACLLACCCLACLPGRLAGWCEGASASCSFTTDAPLALVLARATQTASSCC